MQVDREVVHLSEDSSFTQSVEQPSSRMRTVAVTDDEQMVGVARTTGAGGRQHELLEIAQSLPVARGDLVARFDEQGELPQLGAPQRAVDVAQAVVEAKRDLFLIPAASIMRRGAPGPW